MELLEHPLRTAEFLVLDTETNGRAREGCELTEVGAVLVGGGELHERWGSLVRPHAPLGRGIQRFTGITQAMADGAPEAAGVLGELASRMEGRVLVAHSAAFDRRVLEQAFLCAGLTWPEPPVLCTVALARRLLPLQRERKLGLLAEALGIEVALAHRALADAETCARVFCALFPKLCTASATVGEALALLRGRARRERSAPRRARRPPGARRARPELDFGELPHDPGVYLFRGGDGRVLYVGKSVSIRSRARAHFAPGARAGEWTAQAEVVDYRPTHSELGALLLEARLIKELRPPGNVRGRADERLVYLRCRLDIPFPVLEVAAEPAGGHGLSVGPLRGRRAAGELLEQLSSLFGLRHCGGRCRAASIPRPTGRWAAASPRAWGTSIRTSTAVASTRRSACSSAPRTARAGSCATSRSRCAPRAPRDSTSGRRGCTAGSGACARCCAASREPFAPPMPARGWCSPATRTRRASRSSGSREDASPTAGPCRAPRSSRSGPTA